MMTVAELIGLALGEVGEGWGDVVSCTLSEDELDVRFDDGYGCAEGKPFTLWTTNRVYFPTEYDGLEDVASVSRDPDGRPTDHV